MKSYIQIKNEIVEEKKKYFKNYIFWCRKIKNKAKEVLKDNKLKVLVFGSVIKKCWTPNSDIDVLIISEKIGNNWEDIIRKKVEIKKSVGIFSPFQIHLATPKEYTEWYKKFIKKDYIFV